MALLVNDQSYSGKVAKNFWLPATYGMDTLLKGAAYVVDGIKKNAYYRKARFFCTITSKSSNTSK